MKNNEYLEIFKIQAGKRIYSGERQKSLCQEIRISKSTLWGWKCKYGNLIEKGLKSKEKPTQEERFVEILKPIIPNQVLDMDENTFDGCSIFYHNS